MAKSKNKKQDLNAMSSEEIKSNISEAELRLKKMKFSHAITPIDNPMTIRHTRKEIARLKTALHQK